MGAIVMDDAVIGAYSVIALSCGAAATIVEAGSTYAAACRPKTHYDDTSEEMKAVLITCTARELPDVCGVVQGVIRKIRRVSAGKLRVGGGDMMVVFGMI